MSAVLDKPRGSSQRRLSEPEKRAIIGLVATGETHTSVAQRFNVHANTITRIVKSIRNVSASPLSQAWREKLTNVLPAQSVEAISRSVNDLDDVHKAASTGLALLKGLGHLQGDGMNVTFQQLVIGLPPGQEDRYVFTPPPQDVVVSDEQLINKDSDPRK